MSGAAVPTLTDAWAMRVGGYQLAPHFTLGELMASTRAMLAGIDNWPAEIYQVQALQRLAEAVLEPVRAKFGIVTVSSGYRCPALNSAVGGQVSSQHLDGQAADIVCPAIDNYGLAEWIMKALPFDQLILEESHSGDRTRRWVHVSYALPTRRQVLTMIDGKPVAGLVRPSTA